jgi:arylsulfatase A-like enzyme
MSLFPTLTELCGIPTPAHNQGVSIKALLANPQARWAVPAVTTYRYKNHTVRTSDWRYIRYANGDEELYDETKDPNEWTNLAARPEFAAKKVELAQYLPKSDVPDPAAETKAEKKGEGKRRKNK